MTEKFHGKVRGEVRVNFLAIGSGPIPQVRFSEVPECGLKKVLVNAVLKFCVFFPKMGARQRSGEGVARRNGCPKGCFWRVRFSSAALSV